jgi:hypothetical protein
MRQVAKGECAVSEFDPRAYGPVLGAFVDVDRRRPLGAGAPNVQLREQLAGVTIASAFDNARLADSNMARAVLAGLWLVHDCLHESHEVSQAIDSPAGSFWHAIMHRREGDFSNAKYWLRRVGRHEVLTSLGERAADIVRRRGEGAWTGRLLAGGFDPLAFVDLVEQVERGLRDDARELCLDIQQAEWELLFDSCYRGAIR